MNKFKFDIDDWTGGQTLSGSMGDEIGKTVKPVAFTVLTEPIENFYCLIDRNCPDVKIDWGNGDTTYTSTLSLTEYDNKLDYNYLEYNYSDGKHERLISVTILDTEGYSKFRGNIFKFSSTTTKINEYNIINGLNGVALDFIDMGNSNMENNKLVINISNKITRLNSRSLDFGNVFCDELIIPDTVTHIEEFAVCGININKKITLPKYCKLETFSMEVKCDPAKSIDLLLPVTADVPIAFGRCSGFNMLFPSEITHTGDHAFINIDFGRTFKIPSHIVYIGEKSFGGCSFQGDLVIPDSVKGIGRRAFAYCRVYGGLKLSNSLTEIPVCAFLKCTAKGKLVIPNSVRVIKKGAFENCSGLNGELILSNNLIHIGEGAFKNTSISGTVIIPDSVQELEAYAFRACKKLKKVYVPKKFSHMPITENDEGKVIFY